MRGQRARPVRRAGRGDRQLKGCTAPRPRPNTWSFGGWAKTFADPRLCSAIVDRLTYIGTIIETGTDSYRLAQSRASHAIFDPGFAGAPSGAQRWLGPRVSRCLR
ncbi:ATP-binding protein [Actinomadura sp. 1N219]|uniref:ATP-binding protein n=1 Tax=Actinomadura sp. 1N219 TaxID=3375152 RepID=UPI00379D569D